MNPTHWKARAFCRTALVSSFVFVLGGCISPLPVEPLQSHLEHRFAKNYTVGSQMTVNVGDPMIRFQDYWVEAGEASVATLSKTVTLSGGIVSVTMTAGTQYPVRGRTTLDGVEYTVVASNNDPIDYRGVLVRHDGSLHNRIVSPIPPDFRRQAGGAFVPVIYTLNVSDPSARVSLKHDENVKPQSGYENYELLYTGCNASALTLTYREFSPEGLARVAFFQNLTYDANARSITFKKFKIAVERATSESITYTVVADGY